MALTQEQILEARSKLGIPAEGYKPGSTGTSTSTGDRAAEFRARVAAKRAALAPKGPKEARLGEGLAGEFSAGVLGSLIKTGSTIEKGLDQTLGRGINIALGKGNVPTKTGEEARAFAEKVTDQSAASKTGEFVGTAAQYLAGPGGAAKTATQTGAKLLPKVGAFAARQAPEAAKDVAIGMANTGDVAEGAIQGATAFIPVGAARGAVGMATKSVENAGKKALSAIADVVAPKITPVKGSKDLVSGASKMEVPGMFSKGKVSYEENPRTQKVVDAVKDVWDTSAATVSKNFNNVQEAVEDTAENVVKPFLSQNKVPFNFQDFRDRLTLVKPSTSLKSDKAAFETYGRVREEILDDVANFIRRQGEVEGVTDMNALWDARKILDAKINAELKGTFGTPQYTGAKAAAADMRRAFKDFIVDSISNPGQAGTMNKFYDFLQTARSKGIDIRNEGDAIEALRKQFGINDFDEDVAKAAFYSDKMEKMNLMYEALTNMAPKALSEAGKSVPQIWMKEHPLAAKALGLLGGGALAGLGFGGIQSAMPGESGSN